MRGFHAALCAALLLAGASPAVAQTGACCPPPCYECSVVTEAQCDSMGGGWMGEGTTCDPAP